jgi:hypothetical protein
VERQQLAAAHPAGDTRAAQGFAELAEVDHHELGRAQVEGDAEGAPGPAAAA